LTKRKSQAEHDEMIIALTSHLRHNGHKNVRADIEGYIRPKAIPDGKAGNGLIPDVTSSCGKEFIFEIETADSIDEAHTENQWRSFAAYSAARNKNFIVVVPKGVDKQARLRAETLGVAVKDIWTVR
jgi:hypothetical protein